MPPISDLSGVIRREHARVFRRNWTAEYLIPITIGSAAFLVVFLLDWPPWSEVVALALATLVVYYLLTKRRVRNSADATAEFNRSDTMRHESYLGDCSDYFATTLIPNVLPDFQTWLLTDIINTHFQLIEKRVKYPSAFKAFRLLIVEDDYRFDDLAVTVLEGSRAKSMATAHKVPSIGIGVMRESEFISIAKKHVKDCSPKWKLDFAYFERIQKDGSNDSIVMQLNKFKRATTVNPVPRLKYDDHQDKAVVAQFENLIKEVRSTIFSSGGSLLKEYKFSAYVGVN